MKTKSLDYPGSSIIGVMRGNGSRVPGWFLLVFLNSVIAANAAVPRDYTVLAQATAVESPPSITLSWPAEPMATGYEISRKNRTENFWTVVANLPGSATEWIDTGVAIGTKYEYQIFRSTSFPMPSGWGVPTITAYTYVCAGIRIQEVDHRGTLILIVDETMAAPMTNELTRLRDDLVGDGWSVIRFDVSRNAPVTEIKSLIQTQYNAAPNEVRSVLLFGHVPVPYSGDIFAAGHPPEHQGAFPADVYYAEMDGLWTDSTVNHSGGGQFLDVWPNLGNVPGDGKFDQSLIPSATVELEIGRIDLSDMPAFAPKTESDLLRQYLDKDHAHRHAQRVLPREALLDDRLGEFSGTAWASNGWRSWSSIFGSAGVTEGTFPSLSGGSGYLGYYLCGGGWNNSCDNVTTSQWAQNDPKTAFIMMFGSHFADWNIQDNFLRAPLATTTYGLFSVYVSRPNWFLHTLSLGGTAGEAARLTQNNIASANALYRNFVPSDPWSHSYANKINLEMMGDPTLRLFAVLPPSGLTITMNGAGKPGLSWVASADASLGYHIYRSPNQGGPFTRLTASPVTGTNWSDSSVSNGTFHYQVKAAKLETSAGGTYVNISQAVSAAVTLSGESGATFASWVSDNELTGNDALPEADTDKNGVSNLIEYGLGIAHGSADLSGLPDVATSGGEVTLTYRALQADLSYQPEWSVNLSEWFTTGLTLTTSGGVTTAHLPIGADGKKFLRLKVAQ